MSKILFGILIANLTLFLPGCVREVPPKESAKPAVSNPAGEHTLVGEKNFLHGYEPLNPDSTVNMVVEIPAGSNDKWEVKPSDGIMRWDMKDGKPRVVKYLGYPVNYGMFPKTILPKEFGGDGDPLDALVLGPSQPRGSILRAKVIGVLKLLDKGEQDDKILAVIVDSPLREVDNLAELNRDFPGVTTILETWFSNYKGPGIMEFKGFGDVDEAWQILSASMEGYHTVHEAEAAEVSR